MRLQAEVKKGKEAGCTALTVGIRQKTRNKKERKRWNPSGNRNKWTAGGKIEVPSVVDWSYQHDVPTAIVARNYRLEGIAPGVTVRTEQTKSTVRIWLDSWGGGS